MSKLVIGKIPGYNVNINKPKNNYENRLLNNLTMVKLKPTGYNINWIDKEQGIYKHGSNEIFKSGIDFIDGKITTSSALDNWRNLVLSQSHLYDFLKNSSFSNVTDELLILCTNDSTMSEVFSNSFEKSTAEQLADQIAQSDIAVSARKLKGILTVDSNMGLELLHGIDSVANAGNTWASAFGLENGGSMLSVLSGKALGIQTALPEEWRSSDYNNTLQLMIKLVSPSGDSASIMQNIVKPLLFLILAASPITRDGLNFGFPMLWEVEADGLMDIPLAGISALTITRGGSETQFNKDNQPLNIDVRLTISPLTKGFASVLHTTDSAVVYKKMTTSSPQLLSSSFGTAATKDNSKRESPNYHKSIQL